MKKSKVKIIISIFLFFYTSVLFAQTNWTMANANSNRTSYVADETQLQPPFKLDFEISVKPSMLVTKDDILLISASGSPNLLKAYNLNTNKFIWEFEVPETVAATGMSPSISGNTVFVSGQKGKGLYALDISTGAQKWMKPFKSLYAQNSITDNKQHVFITSGDSLLCLNIDNGETIWAFQTPQLVSPTIKNDTVFITSATSLNALNSLNGDIFWTKDISNAPSRHMPVDNNTIYHLGHNSNKIRAFSTKDGTEKWEYITQDTFKVAYYVEGSGCLTDSVLCVTLITTTELSKIVALNKFTGNLLWEYSSTERAYFAPPIAANGFIYTVSLYEKLIVLDEKTGEVVMEDTNIQGTAIIYDHKLFAASGASVVVYKSELQNTETIELDKQNILVFPNPTSDKINVSYNLENSKHIKIELYDLAGNKIDLLLDKNESAGTVEHTFNAEKYLNGTYVLVLNDGEKRMQQKVVILR